MYGAGDGNRGIEPTTTAWKAVVLPLNYTRTSQKVDFNSIQNI